tara:strand:+ start:155 stop:1261 length:1107 start_codon:yes stop_codon:yes gene_type:complete
MNDRTIIERSVVIATPSTPINALAAAFAPWGGHHEYDWDTQKPDQSLEQLREILDIAPRAIVTIAKPYEKSIRQIASTAKKKGFQVLTLDPEWSEIARLAKEPFEIIPMALDRRHDNGPFDIIGDVHGCALELMDILVEMGHAKEGWEEAPESEWSDYLIEHSEGRKTILLGDLVDRGPMNLATMHIARRLEELGGLRVLGNHDAKVGKWLNGRDVSMGPHQQPTMDEFKHMSAEDRAAWGNWMLDTQAHYLLDEGRLVVAHAGMDEANLGRDTGGAQSMALYGKPSKCGGTDEDGFPLSDDWALEYAGEPVVVHGHVVYDDPRETNGKVVAVDTGCVFGGRLTAYRWPERAYVSVKARREWWERRRK